MAEEYLTVKNFERFQHYKNQGSAPAWIKLHKSLLLDDDFHSLPDKSKAHLMLIWLLVSQRNDRRIPNNAAWVANHIGATDKVDLKNLVAGGWLIPLDHFAKPTLEHSNGTGLGQIRIEEEENRTKEEAIQLSQEPDPDLISPPELMESWNDICKPLGLPEVRELTAPRLVKVKARLREHPKVHFWNEVFAGIERSTFLRGLEQRNGDHKGWKASFDWLIENPTNCVKITEGRYANG